MAGLFSTIITRFRKEAVDWDELEALMMKADLGVPLTLRLIDELRLRQKSRAEDVVEACRKEILKLLPRNVPPLLPLEDRPKVILVVGVNGTGKTTSVAKLGKWLKDRGHSVMLAAADTFRAAAIEQLEVWAQRIDAPLVKGAYRADPSSVCYDAYQSAAKRKIDFLVCDTAGRLHTRHNLMEELGKMERVLGKRDPSAPHEVFVIVDATTGANALSQAKQFQAALTDLTGLVVTKLDGSGKGGVIVAIQDQLGLSPRFVGTGEKVDDFEPFDASKFVQEML